MKFEAHIKPKRQTEFSRGRIAAAKKAVEKERDSVALFPELMRDKTVEARLERIEDENEKYWQRLRNFEAQQWREGRAMLRRLNALTRTGVLRYWDQAQMPHTACYFAGLVRDVAEKHKSGWQKLRELRQLWLVGQGRLPKETVFKKIVPKGK